jgi:hypothetical protein
VSIEVVREYVYSKYTTIKVLPLGDIKNIFMNEIYVLPRNRNLEKDTDKHMWQIHSKVACMKTAVDECEYTPTAFLWLDIDSYKLCSKKGDNVLKYLRELLSTEHFQFPMYSNGKSQMVIPGCWKKLSGDIDNGEYMDNMLNNIQWRFCGSVLWGNSDAIREFWKLYETHFANLLYEYGVLTWEVNFWAWLEIKEPKWNPIWYPGDHNDSMFRLIGEITAIKINDQKSTNSVVYNYPDIPKYRPMSASYIFYKGKHLLNTRFVNYWVCDNGSYWYPSEEKCVIRNKNILSELSESIETIKLDSTSFEEIQNNVGLEASPNSFSEGIEDIRLFEKEGELYCIGSTIQYSSNKKIRIIIGKYDLEKKEISDGNIIEPPTDTWCEKNWIPIANPDKKDELFYIYKWYPMEIGQIHDNKLEIKIKHTTNPCIFANIRGSSCFVLNTIDGTEGLVGVVHFSEESRPRKYYHRLVLLDKTTFAPLKYTDCFVFEKLGVEFCMGFTVLQDKYMFWISQMDRDPKMFSIDQTDIGLWYSA